MSTHLTNRTWIFQANPANYDISRSLRCEQEELWNCNQHADKICQGDQVLIWLSGNRSGIYAQGTVLENPEVRPDNESGQRYWRGKRQGQQFKPRVKVRYDATFLENPLLKVYLQWEPALEKLSVLTQPRGTNFVVRPEEWQALKIWLSKMPL